MEMKGLGSLYGVTCVTQSSLLGILVDNELVIYIQVFSMRRISWSLLSSCLCEVNLFNLLKTITSLYFSNILLV